MLNVTRAFGPTNGHEILLTCFSERSPHRMVQGGARNLLLLKA